MLLLILTGEWGVLVVVSMLACSSCLTQAAPPARPLKPVHLPLRNAMLATQLHVQLPLSEPSWI